MEKKMDKIIFIFAVMAIVGVIGMIIIDVIK